MTEKEAMEIIMQVAYDGEFPLNSNEAFGIACKCIEKQIPKKVVHTHHCPSCDIALPVKRITDDYCSCCFNWSYCPWCGQAIKWE